MSFVRRFLRAYRSRMAEERWREIGQEWEENFHDRMDWIAYHGEWGKVPATFGRRIEDKLYLAIWWTAIVTEAATDAWRQ